MEKDKQNEIHIEKYSKEFTESKFTSKVTRFAQKAGVKTIYSVFLLYYALFDKNFPPAQRALIIGALGYFILPLDLIPDAIPGVGFTDDLVALLYATKTVWTHITPETKAKAKDRVKSIFKNLTDEDFVLFGSDSDANLENQN